MKQEESLKLEIKNKALLKALQHKVNEELLSPEVLIKQILQSSLQPVGQESELDDFSIEAVKSEGKTLAQNITNKIDEFCGKYGVKANLKEDSVFNPTGRTHYKLEIVL